jgi:hypothetical protein
LPALQSILGNVQPLLAAVDPFLEQLNPILQWLEFNQYGVAEFISNGAAGLAAETTPTQPNEVGHYLRQYGPTGAETLAIYPNRDAANRGNAYVAGTQLADTPTAAHYLIFPNFDCKPSGGPTTPVESPLPGQSKPGCWVAPPLAFQGNKNAFVHVGAANYNP